MLLNIIKKAVVGLLLWAFCLVLLIVAVDALEYETTGKCSDCILLDRAPVG